MPVKINKSGKLKLSEADVTRQVRDFLTLEGWRAIRMQVGTIPRESSGGRIVHARVGETGMPDWLFVRYDYGEFRPLEETDFWMSRACVMWIELKAPGKKPTKQQQLWHEAERKRGALVKVVDNFETFRDWYRGVFG